MALHPTMPRPFEYARSMPIRCMPRSADADRHERSTVSKSAPARLRALAAATPGSVEQLLEPRPPSATGMANDPGAWARLTDSEQHVLRLIAAGRSNVENASELVISVRTVERRRRWSWATSVPDRAGKVRDAARGGDSGVARIVAEIVRHAEVVNQPSALQLPGIYPTRPTACPPSCGRRACP